MPLTKAPDSLLVKIKYTNTLPDIPFTPKFIVNPLNLSRFVDYQTTSLEQNSKHELIHPQDLGVDIDLIVSDKYKINNDLHDAEDEKLINDDEVVTTRKKKPHNKVVPWLKKTEYISTEYNRYGSNNAKAETKVGYNIRKKMNVDEIYLDRDSQIKAIESTFEAVKKPIIKHPTKPNVEAVREMPLLPDFESWKYFFAHVKFDNEPTDPSMSQAIIRGAYDEELQENFVVYFLPTEVTMADRLLNPNAEGKEYEYRSSREYTWSAKQENNGDDFFFVIRDDSIYYNRLSMEVNLKKRRNKSQNATISTLVVKTREMNEEEIQGQAEKLDQLKKPQPLRHSFEQSYEDQTYYANKEDKEEESNSSSGSSSSGSTSSPELLSFSSESEADSDAPS